MLTSHTRDERGTLATVPAKRSLVVMFVGAAIVACQPTPAVVTKGGEGTMPGNGGAMVAADSIVLERGPCFGTCPVYRLSIASTGRVTFVGRPRAGGERLEADSVPAATVGRLVAEGERIGFFALPEAVREDTSLCSMPATDHPSTTVSVYRAAGAKRVDSYDGCFVGREQPRRAEPLVRFDAWAASIDSIAGTTRWTRPR